MNRIIFVYRLVILVFVVAIVVFIGYRIFRAFTQLEKSSLKQRRVTKELTRKDSAFYDFSVTNLIVDEAWKVDKRSEINVLSFDRRWVLVQYRIKIGALSLDSLIKVQSVQSVFKTPMVPYNVVERNGWEVGFRFDEPLVTHSIHIVLGKGSFKEEKISSTYRHYKIATDNFGIRYDNDDTFDFVFNSVNAKVFELGFYRDGVELICLINVPRSDIETVDSYVPESIVNKKFFDLN